MRLTSMQSLEQLYNILFNNVIDLVIPNFTQSTTMLVDFQ